jgi:hypothetical protein
MPSLGELQSSSITKLLVIGNSGVGKTGALASLVKEGFKLRILDFDNGLDVLAQLVRKNCPDKLGNVEYRTLRDKHKASMLGPVLDGPAKAFPEGLKMLDKWKYVEGGKEVDLGSPATWGPECVLVIDSLTFMSRAALDWGEPLTPSGQGGKKDGRAVYGTAMKAIEKVLALLTGKDFNTNVIVLSHIRYQIMDDGTTRGWPTAVGEALGPTIQKQTPFVEWQCKCQGAQDDVDQDALNESLGGKSLSDITRRLTFYITEDSVYRLQEFLFKHLQVAEVGSGVSLREAIAMAAGHSFLGTIRHQPSPDGTRVYDNISTTAAI